uniref:Uncharacterized protein LOC114326963 n=1 Tax=Diabrotica virgifera virgifera TaxID=50390 RepID=A0A6P7FCY3_DIAVI
MKSIVFPNLMAMRMQMTISPRQAQFPELRHNSDSSIDSQQTCSSTSVQLLKRVRQCSLTRKTNNSSGNEDFDDSDQDPDFDPDDGFGFKYKLARLFPKNIFSDEDDEDEHLLTL